VNFQMRSAALVDARFVVVKINVGNFKMSLQSH